MNKQLEILNSANLDLDLFFSVSIDITGLRIMGFYSFELENYCLSNGFKHYDNIHTGDDNMIELTNGLIRIVLAK